jgi:hypothetical protein
MTRVDCSGKEAQEDTDAQAISNRRAAQESRFVAD